MNLVMFSNNVKNVDRETGMHYIDTTAANINISPPTLAFGSLRVVCRRPLRKPGSSEWVGVLAWTAETRAAFSRRRFVADLRPRVDIAARSGPSQGRTKLGNCRE